MNFLKLLIVTVLFFSCNSNNITSLKIDKGLSELFKENYKTEEANLSKGIDINSNKGKETYIELSLTNYKNNTFLDDNLIASNLFLHLYNSLSESEKENTDKIIIRLIENNHSNTSVFTNSTIDKLERSLSVISLFEKFVISEQYVKAKKLFNTEMVDTSQINISKIMEPIEKEIGTMKQNVIEGFEFGETDYNGKSIPVSKLYFATQFEKGRVLSSYGVDLDNGDQKLLFSKIN